MAKKRVSKRRGRSAAFMRSINPNLVRKATKRKKTTMAKRKSTKRRSAKTSAITRIFARAAAPMIYGAVREKTSNMISPYTAKLPLGNVSDEAGMLAVGWGLKKFLFKKAGIAREIITAGQDVELARVGEAVMKGETGISFGGILGGTQTTTSSNGYVFN